ncbi:leptin receptor precursor [Xenopus tropicalis]|uniref:Leptin receptor n=1 Tax=Xenopus tropicalis TaxID=8364 RepID=Q27HR3_XENTR|nr:leptin receptor precursor [Xenopus tropicalis]ABD63000.2 leptin receptor [Xenopus tropicalis]|eukprot:NP_001037866.2 leptin receptor precursor [Xenopus tropicalis]
MFWHWILPFFLLLRYMQITAAYSEMYWTPPSDFFLTCILTNKSVNYPLLAGILQNKSDISGKYDTLEGRSDFRCTHLADLKSQGRVSCCLWDHLNTNFSSQNGVAELKEMLFASFASDIQLEDFSWKVQCSFEEKANTLICDLQLLPETKHIVTDYRISLHYSLVAKSELKGTAECRCFGYEKCECIVPSVKFNDTYILWIEILNITALLHSPPMSVVPYHIVKPDPPDDLRAEIMEQGTLKVFWLKPISAAYELQYQVRYTVKAAETNSQVYLLVNETSVIISDIQPCTEMVIEVRCINLHKSGLWSDWSKTWVLNSQDVFYFPQKVLVSSGSSTSVSCLFCDNGKKVPSSNITWWLNFGEKIPKHQYRTTSDYFSKVFLTHLNTTKPKGKFRYDALHCCINHNECHHRYAEIYVLDVNISISCETDGNQKMMTCRWSSQNMTLPEGSVLQFKYYRNKLYCLDKDLKGNVPISKDCQLQMDGFYECTFEPVHLVSGYIMWIEIQHHLGALNSPPVCILPINTVKPLAPSRVRAEMTKGSGHLYVSWKRPALPSTDLQFQVRYCLQGQGIIWKVLDIFEEEFVSIQVPDVCASYTVQVRSRRTDGVGYWSDWSQPVHTVVRDIRVPLQGPTFWRTTHNNPMQKGDNISIIWQPLPSEHSLCSIQGYEVIHLNSKNVTWSKYVGNTTKHTFTLSDNAVTVTLLAVNSLGYSLTNSKLTFSCEMSTVTSVESFRVYHMNNTCAVAVWTMLPKSDMPLEFIVEWKNLGNEEKVQWMNIPRNMSRCYIEDNFFAIEKYVFSLYPVFPEGVGRSKVVNGFSTVELTEAPKDAGLYVILPVISFSVFLLMGTILISHQRMKKLFWKDVPNPKHCSWAQGVNFEKPDTLENLFMKHHKHPANGSPFLFEPEAVFEDLSIDKQVPHEIIDNIPAVTSLFTVSEEPDHDSACESSNFSSGCAFETDHQEMVYSSICQSSIEYATIMNNTQQCRKYSSERKTSLSSFDGCLLGNSSMVIGNHDVDKQTLVFLAGLHTKQPDKMSCNSTVSSEGFSEPLDHEDSFLEADGLERNLYYLEFGSIQQCGQQDCYSEKPLGTFPFQENISYKEIDFKKDKASEFIDNYDIKNSFKKAFLCYMPQFQTHSIKLPGEMESETLN